MKRKFLEDLGIEKETIDNIMSENGKDVEKAKADYNDIRGQLDTANTTLEDLKKNNTENETLQKTIAEHKATIDKLQQEATQKDFDYNVNSALSSCKAKNIKALKGLLELDKVTLDGDNIKGLTEQIEALKKSDSYLFEAEQQTPVIGGAKPTNTGSSPNTETQLQSQIANAMRGII